MKCEHEFLYWYKRYIIEGKTFTNKHFKNTMLGMAQQENDNFLKGKIVADFGCGPRGSLAWTDAPSLKIGIDILIPTYLDSFGETMLRHNMLYVSSTEKTIPIPDNFVDVLFTLNSMDHVENFAIMAKEVLRILKKGGTFAASFNLNEPPTETEPQTLNESTIRIHILKNLNVISYRLAKKHNGPGGAYYNLRQNILASVCDPKSPYILWVMGTKK